MTRDYHQHDLVSTWLSTYSERNNIGPHHATNKKWNKTGQRLRAHKQGENPHFWHHDPQAHLQTTSTCQSLTLSTGSSLFEEVICPLISRTTTELIFVTCFWAESPSLAFLGDTLRKLAKKALQSQTSMSPQAQKRIRVRISFSSLSLFQKLFHTRSSHGHTYPPSTWVSKLGLPDPETELLPGLDMTVTSFFWLPFSVMHPKFVVVDRELVALPSCNVSWEEWFEGCVVMKGSDVDRSGEGGGGRGGIIERFVRYAEEGWDMGINRWDGKEVQIQTDGLMNGAPSGAKRNILDENVANASSANGIDRKTRNISTELPTTVTLGLDHVPTLFLPSSHIVNPRFRPFPWQKTYPPVPPTPLNTFLLTAFSSATSSIYIQTPNITCRPVLEELVDALARGVNVTIVTSERLMVVEQLVTAGRTTKMCVKQLVKQHERMSRRRLSSTGRATREERLEEGLMDNNRKMGVLRIMFFEPLAEPSAFLSEQTAAATTSNLQTTAVKRQEPNPVQSHLKLTIIDGEITVLGSGNMDRASWYTSRELGVGYFSRGMAGRITKALFGQVDDGEGGVLKGRVKKYYDSRDAMVTENG